MKSVIAIAAAGFALLTSVVGAPAASAEPEWTMPSLKGMNLEKAEQLYTETVGAQGPKLKLINEHVGSWKIIAPAMWDVCEQSPAAGTPITPENQPELAANTVDKCS
jgi:hypothetical protein